MWTTSPGRAIRNAIFKDVGLNAGDRVVVKPSMILGYDHDLQVKNLIFENLKIGDEIIHEEIRWYMVSDLVPVWK